MKIQLYFPFIALLILTLSSCFEPDISEDDSALTNESNDTTEVKVNTTNQSSATATQASTVSSAEQSSTTSAKETVQSTESTEQGNAVVSVATTADDNNAEQPFDATKDDEEQAEAVFVAQAIEQQIQLINAVEAISTIVVESEQIDDESIQTDKHPETIAPAVDATAHSDNHLIEDHSKHHDGNFADSQHYNHNSKRNRGRGHNKHRSSTTSNIVISDITLTTVEEQAVSTTISAVIPVGTTLKSYRVSEHPKLGYAYIKDGVLEYKPKYNRSGSDHFSIVAIDSDRGVSNAASVTISIANVNDAPQARYTVVHLTDLYVAQATATEVVSAKLMARLIKDADGDTLTYSLDASSQTFLALASESGTISLTRSLTQSDVGAYAVVVNATDGTASGSLTLMVTVDGHIAPIAQSSTIVVDSINEGDATATVVVSSAIITNNFVASESLTFVLAKASHHLFAINSTSGEITLNAIPDDQHVGAHSLTVYAKDSLTHSQVVIELTIVNVNDEPILLSDSYAIAAGQTIALQLQAFDADNDTLTYSVSTNPTIGTLSGSGQVLQYYQAGNSATSLIYAVTDGTVSKTATIYFDVIGSIPLNDTGHLSSHQPHHKHSNHHRHYKYHRNHRNNKHGRSNNRHHRDHSNHSNTQHSTATCGETNLATLDCRNGRDRLIASGLSKVGAGIASFDLTKLGQSGTALTVQTATWSQTGSEQDGSNWSCVLDNHTGLVWEVKSSDSSNHDASKRYTWGGTTADGYELTARQGDYSQQWNTLVTSANANDGLCGYTDWRVPTIFELTSLVNQGSTDSVKIDSHYFPNASSHNYWSATPYSGNSQFAHYVNLKLGASGIAYRGFDYRVRLVRGAQPNSSTAIVAVSSSQIQQSYITNYWTDDRYQVDNGLVRDAVTGLAWQQCVVGLSGTNCEDGAIVLMSWSELQSYLEGYSHANYQDWRLPNAKELQSIVAFDRQNPSINATVFPNTPASLVWSALSSQRSTLSYHFQYGVAQYLVFGEQKYAVRLVRAGQ